jgi:hypothetical protein
MSRTLEAHPELEAIRPRLGTVPDHEIAQLLGTSTSIVGRFRRRYGIPAYQGYKFGQREGAEVPRDPEASGEARSPGASRGRGKRGPDRSPRRSKLGPFRHLIGVLTDAEVAERAGVTREAVRMFRRRSLSPGTDAGGAAAAAPRSISTAAADGAADGAAGGNAAANAEAPRYAFALQLSGGGEEVVLLARDIEEAAARAASAVGGREVTGLRVLGLALG